MRYHSLLCAALIAFATPAHADTPAHNCDSFAHGMIDRVVVILHDKSQNETQKRAALTTLFQEAVDTDWIGKFVLGRFWKTATDAQKQQYLSEYHSYLSNSYISKFDGENSLNVDSIQIASITPAGDKQFETKSLIKHKGEDDVHVDYLLEQSPAGCRVHDIKVEGVSLLVTQRSEFQALANTSGIKGVIDAMHTQMSAQ